MKPATEILLSAAFALTPEENWTKGALARDATGDGIYYTVGTAISWCVVGAACAAGRELKLPSEVADEALSYLDKVCGMNRVMFNNNVATHEQLLDAIYRAAELAECQDTVR